MEVLDKVDPKCWLQEVTFEKVRRTKQTKPKQTKQKTSLQVSAAQLWYDKDPSLLPCIKPPMFCSPLLRLGFLVI